MKQAYTNTIRNGGGKPLTIATGSKKTSARGKAKQQVPKCAYGAACNRKGCAFRHPDKGSAAYESYYEDPRSKICLPYLAGLCSYGNKCMNRHPGDEEAEEVKAKYKQKVCSYGDSCQTEGCLYFHPYEALESAVDEQQGHDHSWSYGELSSDVERLDLNGKAVGSAQDPTYDEWISLNCPPPPHLDVNELNNIWFHTSGLQRDPWDVYNLMYPKQVGGDSHVESLNAAQTWTPLTAAKSTGEFSALSKFWIPTSINSIQENADPKSFDEWKKNGCTYPSWFQSDIDPWYDDEGVRRSLEEVYKVLYGENAQSRFEEQEALRYKLETASDPTPAELAAMGDGKADALVSNSYHENNVNSQPSGGGWASIASKPAALQTKIDNSDNFVPTQQPQQRNKTVIMPKECWLPSTDNSSYFVSHTNPINRFAAVNEQHKSHLSSVVIPTSLESSTPNGKVTLIDVHFQSAKSVVKVLDQYLPPALEQHEEVWIIAGLGTHVEAGHQKRGGVLFNAVKKYLLDNQKEMNLDWRYGKDAPGAKYSNGSFVVGTRK